MTRRALVFAFYDQDGIVDEINANWVRALTALMDKSVIVVNGDLTDEGRATFEAMGAEVIQRGNDGYDVWAFKTGIEHLEADRDAIDELVIANSSVFGPVHPLSDMFDEMSTRDIDFWGITRHAAKGSKLSRARSERSHIQSYFTVLRKSVLDSDAFWAYWHDMPRITGYADAVRTHEMQQTGYLEDHGFRWEVYVDTSDLEPTTDNPIIGAATELLDRGCPVFKRRMLYLGLDGLLSHTATQGPASLIRWLRTKSEFELATIKDHAIRTLSPAALRLSIQDDLTESSPSGATDDVAIAIAVGPMTAAAIDHWCALVGADRVAVIATDADAASAATLAGDRVRVLTHPTNPLAALAALETSTVLVIDDIAAKGATEDARVAREHVALLLWDLDALGRACAALAKSTTAVVALVPPIARHDFGALGGEDTKSTVRARQLASSLGATATESDEFRPTPGAAMVIRLEELREWLKRVESIEVKTKRFKLHDWLLAFTLSVPVLGARVRMLTNTNMALSHATVLGAIVHRVNATMGTTEGEPYDAAISRLREDLDATVFFDTGGGFRHAGAIMERVPAGDDISLTFTVPAGCTGIRFDPCEGSGLAVHNATVTPSTYRMAPANGTRSRGYDVFSWPDPVYELSGPFTAGDTVTIQLGHAERLRGDTAFLAELEARIGGRLSPQRALQLPRRALRKGLRLVRRFRG